MAAWDVVQGTDLGLQEVVQYTVCNVVSMFSLAGVPGATELLLSLLYANSSSTARPQVTFVRVVADNKLLVFHSGQVLTSGGQSRLSTLTRMKEFVVGCDIILRTELANRGVDPDAIPGSLLGDKNFVNYNHVFYGHTRFHIDGARLVKEVLTVTDREQFAGMSFSIPCPSLEGLHLNQKMSTVLFFKNGRLIVTGIYNPQTDPPIILKAFEEEVKDYFIRSKPAKIPEALEEMLTMSKEEAEMLAEIQTEQNDQTPAATAGAAGRPVAPQFCS